MKLAAHCARRAWNFLTNAIGPYAAISRQKIADVEPDRAFSAAFGIPVRLLSSPNRSQENSNSNVPNKSGQGWPHPRRKPTKPALKHSFTTNFIKPPMRSMTEARARESKVSVTSDGRKEQGGVDPNRRRRASQPAGMRNGVRAGRGRDAQHPRGPELGNSQCGSRRQPDQRRRPRRHVSASPVGAEIPFVGGRLAPRFRS